MKKALSQMTLLLMSIFTFTLYSCSNDDNTGGSQLSNDQKKVYFVYTLDTSTGDLMSRASSTNEEVFNEFYEKIKTGEIAAENYELTLTEVTTGAKYSFKGKWSNHDLVTLRTGTYKVTGTSTAEGKNIQEKCSFAFNELVEISITSSVITLHAKYDCSLLIFNNSEILSLQNYNGTTSTDLFNFKTYKYAFVNDVLYEVAYKNDAYILGKYTDNAEFKIFTGNLNFEKGKYYVYNSVSNGFNIPPMEEGGNASTSKFVEVCGIKWAKGNLQYDEIEGGDVTFQTNWKIAPNQWHYFHYYDGITQYNAVVTAKQIDHFTWGVCGDWGYLNNINYYSQATNKDINSKLYTDEKCSYETFDFSSAKYGDLAYWASKGQYRLPKAEEIEVLINQASYQYGYFLSFDNIKIYGMLFTTPSGSRVTNSTVKEFTKDDLAKGLFLPYAGRAVSKNKYIEGLNSTVDIWSSKVDVTYPQTLSIVNNKPNWGNGQWRTDLLVIRPVCNY